MKILLVQDANWFKKGPHQQHHLIEILATWGHEVKVIGYDQLWREEPGDIIAKRKQYNNIHRLYDNSNLTYISPAFIKLPFLDYISYLFTSRAEVKKCIDEFNPDVVVGVTSILSNYWGAYYAKKRNTPFVYYWTDIIHTLIPFKPFHPIAKLIEKSIIKKSTSIIAMNEGLKDYLINFGAKSDIIDIIPGGVDFERFNPSREDPNYIREKYNISKDDLVLFFMGWIYEFSGLKEVVSELSKIKNSYPNMKILIVGEGEYYPQLRDFVETSGMTNEVILTGKRPYEEIPQLIAAADICLLPAYNNVIMRDIVPIKMYEYLAMHKPVISTKLSGVFKEFGYNGGVIYVDKSEDVMKKVIELSEDDLKKNSLLAKEFIKKCSWDNITSEFEQLLKSVVPR